MDNIHVRWSFNKKVTNLFEQTFLNIAFKSTKTIYQQLSHKSENTNPSGI